MSFSPLDPILSSPHSHVTSVKSLDWDAPVSYEQPLQLESFPEVATPAQSPLPQWDLNQARRSPDIQLSQLSPLAQHDQITESGSPFRTKHLREWNNRLLSSSYTDLEEVVEVVELLPDKSPFFRSQEFFFEDANLVLISTENMAFGVHRGVFQRLSPVFASMFSDALKQPETEVFEGLPYVQLSDSTLALMTLLEVIYDQKPIEAIEAPHKSLLTICDKYHIDSILRRILVFLLQTFPDTLENWDRPRDEEQIKEAINIAVAAYKLDMKVLLPSCLYTIMMGENNLTPDLDKLPHPLLLKYHRGYVHFSSYFIDFYRDTLLGRVSPPKGCNKAKCKEIWVAFRERTGRSCFSYSNLVRQPNPLLYLENMSCIATIDDDAYCDRCRSFLPIIFRDARTSVWDSLPREFGIGNSWAALRGKRW